jgi:hypothetical protein
MQHAEQKNATRRKFLFWGLGLASAFTAFRLLIPGKKKKGPAKMLTEDGRLVEVDLNFIKKTGQKISDKEIIDWIKNKPTKQ